MPFGFAADTADDQPLTFSKAKSCRSEIIPVDKLSEDRKQNLTIACWNHDGLWEDLLIGDHYITDKSEAIRAVKEGSKLGKELVQITISGYTHIYRSHNFILHDHTKHPLVKIIGQPKNNSQSDWINNCRIGETPFSIINHLSITVCISAYIYSERLQTSYFGPIICIVPADSTIEIKESIRLPAGNESLSLVAHAYKADSGDVSILDCYVAYPGCTIWDVTESFRTNSFFPSAWNSKETWSVRITNNLKTYVAIWFVMPNGSLQFVSPLRSCFYADYGPCYIGTSLVATRGYTVISEFFVDSTECITWSLDVDTPPEVYVTGDNNYIFYQVNTPQDDIITPEHKTFSKQITISSEVTYLYASVFGCINASSLAPGHVIVTIDSKDVFGVITHYNSNTNTDSLYIQMTGKSLQKLCVKNPPAGNWIIEIKAMSNTPVHFQFQTLPTANPYDTMKAALSSCFQLQSNWEDIAYAGFRNIASMHELYDIESNDHKFPVSLTNSTAEVLTAVGVALKLFEVDVSLQDGQNDQTVTKEVTDTETSTTAPIPSHRILLVDANGADKGTEFIYMGRNKHIYPYVEASAFQKKYTKLVGRNEATKNNFESKLKGSSLKLVSVAGHGNIDRVCGYTAKGVSPWTPILLSEEVTEELAAGKIFHFLACNTASKLGETLLHNRAIAFIGYNKPFNIRLKDDDLSNYRWMLKPDCIIDQKLIEGKTVNQAVEIAKAEYRKTIKLAYESGCCMLVIGMLKCNCDALEVIGNHNATLLKASRQDEQEQCTSQDEQHSGEHNQTAS